MASTYWLVLCSAVLCVCMVMPIGAESKTDRAVEPAVNDENGVKRVARSFGTFNDVPGLYDPRIRQMIDWNSVFNKRVSKRALGGADGSNRLGELSPDSPYFQDWSSTFGRNYRSFDNSIPNFGGGHNLRPSNLQNWQQFFGRYAKRMLAKRDFGDGGSPDLGDFSSSKLQNWRNFFQRGARGGPLEDQ